MLQKFIFWQLNVYSNLFLSMNVGLKTSKYFNYCQYYIILSVLPCTLLSWQASLTYSYINILCPSRHSYSIVPIHHYLNSFCYFFVNFIITMQLMLNEAIITTRNIQYRKKLKDIFRRVSFSYLHPQYHNIKSKLIDTDHHPLHSICMFQINKFLTPSPLNYCVPLIVTTHLWLAEEPGPVKDTTDNRKIFRRRKKQGLHKNTLSYT